MNRLLSRTVLVSAILGLPVFAAAQNKMQVGFLWHMHQPVYYPGENITQTQNAGRYSFSLYDVHNQRFGPYTSWPKDAITSASGLPNAGASVSFSGTLMENLNQMQSAGVNGGMWNNWQSSYTQARQMMTAEGNSRLDMIGFTYAHALAPLLDTRDIRMQLRMDKVAVQANFGSAAPLSKGFFPAETAFSERMIPALKAEGYDWTIVDNIHMDRATKNYPHTNASNLYAPNRADQVNADPAQSGGAWVQLNNLWAPSKVSAPFGYRPHNVQYVDPNSGVAQTMVAVPGARYEGNEDGRGGFGALQYQAVMDQYKQYNTDPAHPMLVVLHHDGDNYGGGSDSYYHNNWNNMVNWANGNQNYNVTTISDYLKKYPVASSDVIHVENGSWAGADNGDPEFKKWLGDPSASGWSPDRNSWAVLTAAKNRVYTAEDIVGAANPQNVINNTGTAAERAWHYLVQAQSSDHWYWDGTEIWDSNVTRGANLAVAQANTALTPAAIANETTPPSVFIPQRESYNPGGFEWGTNPEPSDFEVWTFAYDVSGLNNVTLKYRLDNDGENPLGSTQNETYTGGTEVGQWVSVSMNATTLNNPSGILNPTVRAQRFGGMITGLSNKLVDYYVEATDAKGNVTKTDIQHVYVGNSNVSNPTPGDFTMDGTLDAGAITAASNSGMTLSWSMDGNKLYLATNDAGEGSDHFIYVALAPGALRPANWAKAGQIAGWDAYLADENDNSYSNWFDAPAGASARAATGPNGGVLEGVLDLGGMYGSLPEEIWVAVGLYATADGGALLSTHQVPPSLNGDGNIDAGEYIKIRLVDFPQWALAASGNWNTGANWNFGRVPNASGARATFSQAAAARTVTLDNAVTLGRLRFNSTNSFTINGIGSIAISGGERMIEAVAGSHNVNVPVSLAGATSINVQTGASLSLTGAVNATGQNVTKVGGGDLQLGTLTASTLTLQGGQTKLLSNSSASKVQSLVFQNNAVLDLGMSMLAIDHDGSLTYAAVLGWLASGKLTATAGANASIGVAESFALNLSSFGGQSIDPTTMLIRRVTVGDTNLDGGVNFDDLLAIAQHYGSTSAKWVEGDVNYDGSVTFDDLLLLAQNYSPSAVGEISGFGDSVNADWELARSIVPEPSMLLAFGFARRRRM